MSPYLNGMLSAGGGNRTRASTLGRSQATITSHPRVDEGDSRSRLMCPWPKLLFHAILKKQFYLIGYDYEPNYHSHLRSCRYQRDRQLLDGLSLGSILYSLDAGHVQRAILALRKRLSLGKCASHGKSLICGHLVGRDRLHERCVGGCTLSMCGHDLIA